MKRNLTIILICLLGLAVLSACGSGSSSGFPDGSSYSEEQLSLGAVNRFAGVVTASSETKIEKDPNRNLASVSVSAGDDVTSGQVLFTYDSSQAQLNYDKAAIELEQLKISLDSYYNQQAALQEEKANAPESEQLSYTIQIQELDTSIRETSYNITQKQKEVDKLQTALNELEVRSPIDGKVQSVNVDGGTDANGTAAPFIVLMSTNAFRIKGYINEENAKDLSLGSPVIVRARTGDKTWNGTIASIDYKNPVTSQSSTTSGDTSEVTTTSKYPFYVDLNDSEGLMLGQHVFVEEAK